MTKIVKTEGVCGGSPRIEGHRIPVATIVKLNERLDVNEIIGEDRYPFLSREEVETALEYYKENTEEIKRDIRKSREAERKLKEKLMKKYPRKVDSHGMINFNELKQKVEELEKRVKINEIFLSFLISDKEEWSDSMEEKLDNIAKLIKGDFIEPKKVTGDEE